MRRLGSMMTVVGAVAFAALLALGLALGSDSVSAQDGTATATPAPSFCTPTLPSTYNGSVTVDGSPATDGVTITASIDGTVWGTTTTTGGKYVLDVPTSPPTTEPCFPGAGTVTFACDGVAATETDTWSAGLTDLNLTCAAAAATATPAATAAPPAATATPPAATATPPAATATPAAPPETGMGGASGSGGFIWWPLALAAAAMTSVAGLFTARWARR